MEEKPSRTGVQYLTHHNQEEGGVGHESLV